MEGLRDSMLASGECFERLHQCDAHFQILRGSAYWLTFVRADAQIAQELAG